MSRRGCFRIEAATKLALRCYPPEAPSKFFWAPRSVVTHTRDLEPLLAHPHVLTEIEFADWWCRAHPELDKYFS